MSATLGWDVGGAHLKLARLDRDGRLDGVKIVPCALWRGLGELDAAFDAISAETPPGARLAATMTGELVDLWPDRATGVAAISAKLAERLGGDVAIYAGAAGFTTAQEAPARWSEVASANWRATAEALAAEHSAGLLIDVGSTTSDLIAFDRGAVRARGTDDLGRLVTDELVYLGVARTPVIALAPRVPFAGGWIVPMAEHFATTADVFRLTGELPENADLHPSADGCEKSLEGSARRLLRMVGTDLTPETRNVAGALARWLGEAASRRIADAAACVLSRPDGPRGPTVFGAGVGRFLAAGVAEKLGLLYRDVGHLWSPDPALAEAAADCAPAVAVARLLSMQIEGDRPRQK